MPTVRVVGRLPSFPTMRAILVQKFGGPEALSVRDDVAKPKCGEKCVLIRVSHAGVNPVDTYRRSGAYNPLPTLPFTPGSDACGVVEEVGVGCTRLKVGERVYCAGATTGSYAQFTVAPELTTYALPTALSTAEGAAVGTAYYTAYRALFLKAHGRRGQTLLVHGASGGVGLAAVQMGVAEGMTVLGTAGSEEGMALVKANGANHVFNHNHKDYAEEIVTATKGKSCDVILEMAAHINLERDMQLMGARGCTIIGNRGRIEIDARALMGKEASVVGVALANNNATDWQEMGAYVNAGLSKGTLKPVVHTMYTMAKAPASHVDVMEQRGGARGRLVIDCQT